MSTYEELSERVARAIAQQIKVKSNSCLGLPTGHTPLGVYRHLSKWSREGQIDWSNVRCFALDDYLETDEKHTFHYFLDEHLYSHTNLPAANKFNPCMTDNYDALIAEHGGLDLTILGIGGNGHIAFNEPGTCARSWTHCTWLNQSTRLANQDSFQDLASVPTRGVTMGLATILESRWIVLMASGEKKKDIVERAFQGPVTVEVPASLLKQHAKTDVWTDFSADYSFPSGATQTARVSL
ncbi:MAG: glucosamine-6-phosphate deaminase [Cyanobacteria bacterium SZAS LIN-2]|nr:glucosamine-6-phosphate deaminase [Cyanobacteria bacterium SZAS LIN-3]MBS1997896.1 glucosamine-6-phosphate deaminase [Cyanobacteria bacterium SZAS LIN-2]MBS2010204.1 glucosamine-6-phosphate deaminase [Cyanobacteria bacterium SZAS TMP-1]